MKRLLVLAAAHRAYALAAAGAVALLLLAWGIKIAAEHRGADNAEKKARLRQIDSVQAANKIIKTFAESESRRADSIADVAHALADRQRTYTDRAEMIRIRVDSFVVTLPDTATTVPRPAFQLVISERDQWRLSYFVADSGRRAQALRAEILEGVRDSLDAGWLGTRTALAGAEKTIKRLTAPCRIAWVVPCPPRELVFVAGIAGGYAAAKALEKKK